jgi:LPS sulfotransferase NodH
VYLAGPAPLCLGQQTTAQCGVSYDGDLGAPPVNGTRMALYHQAAARSRRRAPASPVAALGRPAGGQPPFPDFTYVICTNPRSGSWLLSEGLASTALAGNPREWFNAAEERKCRAEWRLEHPSDLSRDQYLAHVARSSTTPNGHSGLKLHYYQFAELPAILASGAGGAISPAQTLTRAFPRARYIWLTRDDKARQAISLYLAARTEQWWRIGPRESPQAPAGPDDLDPGTVLRLERLLTSNDENWLDFFLTSHITPLVVHYEDLAADYAGTLRRVLRWLGVPGTDALAIAPSRLHRQSGPRTEAWLRRYLAVRDATAARLDAPRRDPAGADTDAPGGAHGPLTERFDQLAGAVGPAWQQWIGQGKLLGAADEELISVLVANGHGREAAAAAVARAGDDDYLTGAAHAFRRLRAAGSVLSALGELARLDSGLAAIERRAAPSRDEFRDRYYAASRPVILTGLLDDWPAVTRWTPEHLKAVAGDERAEVMIRRGAGPDDERSGGVHRRELRFADYVDLVHSGRVTNDYYLVANNGFFERPWTRPLLADCPAFPAYLRPGDGGAQCFFWYGPAGTVTPLHRDTSNILIAQVTGTKRYRLIPAAQWHRVYNRAGVFSDVDAARPDLDRHPGFRDATVLDFVLRPGEVLFMPVGWWHHVLALEPSISVSFTAFVFPNHFTWE